VPPPKLTIEGPAQNANVFGEIEVRVTADPERATHLVVIERSLNGGAWEPLTTDSSSPVYTAYDDLASVPVGTEIRYRAMLTEPDGTVVTTAVRTVTPTEPQPLVASVTVAGPLQSEMGCPADWDPACDASDMTFDTNTGLWEKTVTLPPGDYEWKVAINNNWDVNYGAGGAAGGGNIALSLPAPTSVTFIWDQVSHVPTATVG
jgi:alpha-amylase